MFSVIQCPVLNVPEYGNVSTSDRDYLTEVTYSCDEGYELNTSNSTKMCLLSGEWSPPDNVSCDGNI